MKATTKPYALILEAISEIHLVKSEVMSSGVGLEETQRTIMI